MADIGESGRNSDGGVLANSNLGIAMNEGMLELPEPRISPAMSKIFPHVFVADEAFALKPFMVKPYAKNTLDERKKSLQLQDFSCKKGNREMFWYLCFKVRIFRRPIIRKVDIVVAITKAVVLLHNYLMKNESNYCPPGYADADTPFGTRSGEWRGEFQNYTGMVSIGSNNFTRSADKVREGFCTYFDSDEGSVHWQWDMVNRTADSSDSDSD